ncbi:hypothetical protein Tco_0325280, partial [Tanacetum coccineum]
YMAQLQEVTPDQDNSGPIFDDEPMHKLVEIILFIVDSTGCSKHMTENLKLLTNFVEKFLGTVKFGNDQIAPILGYGDLVQGTITIKRVYSSNMHTFYQHNPSAQHWTKDHPLEQVIGNPSQSVRTRRQLEIDGEICMFALTVSQTEPKNIK